MESTHSFPYTPPGLELVAAHNSLSWLLCTSIVLLYYHVINHLGSRCYRRIGGPPCIGRPGMIIRPSSLSYWSRGRILGRRTLYANLDICWLDCVLILIECFVLRYLVGGGFYSVSILVSAQLPIANCCCRKGGQHCTMPPWRVERPPFPSYWIRGRISR